MSETCRIRAAQGEYYWCEAHNRTSHACKVEQLTRERDQARERCEVLREVAEVAVRHHETASIFGPVPRAKWQLWRDTLDRSPISTQLIEARRAVIEAAREWTIVEEGDDQDLTLDSLDKLQEAVEALTKLERGA